MKQIIPRLPVGVRARRNMIALLLAIVPWLQVSAADRYWPPIADPPTNEHRPGKWVWAELLTRDVARAAEFHAKVFNWTYETYGPEDDLQTYTLIFADGVPIGGMVFADPPIRRLCRMRAGWGSCPWRMSTPRRRRLVPRAAR